MVHHFLCLFFHGQIMVPCNEALVNIQISFFFFFLLPKIITCCGKYPHNLGFLWLGGAHITHIIWIFNGLVGPAKSTQLGFIVVPMKSISCGCLMIWWCSRNPHNVFVLWMPTKFTNIVVQRLILEFPVFG